MDMGDTATQRLSRTGRPLSPIQTNPDNAPRKQKAQIDLMRDVFFSQSATSETKKANEFLATSTSDTYEYHNQTDKKRLIPPSGRIAFNEFPETSIQVDPVEGRGISEELSTLDFFNQDLKELMSEDPLHQILINSTTTFIKNYKFATDKILTQSELYGLSMRFLEHFCLSMKKEIRIIIAGLCINFREDYQNETTFIASLQHILEHNNLSHYLSTINDLRLYLQEKNIRTVLNTHTDYPWLLSRSYQLTIDQLKTFDSLTEGDRDKFLHNRFGLWEKIYSIMDSTIENQNTQEFNCRFYSGDNDASIDDPTRNHISRLQALEAKVWKIRQTDEIFLGLTASSNQDSEFLCSAIFNNEQNDKIKTVLSFAGVFLASFGAWQYGASFLNFFVLQALKETLGIKPLDPIVSPNSSMTNFTEYNTTTATTYGYDSNSTGGYDNSSLVTTLQGNVSFGIPETNKDAAVYPLLFFSSILLFAIIPSYLHAAASNVVSDLGIISSCAKRTFHKQDGLLGITASQMRQSNAQISHGLMFAYILGTFTGELLSTYVSGVHAQIAVKASARAGLGVFFMAWSGTSTYAAMRNPSTRSLGTNSIPLDQPWLLLPIGANSKSVQLRQKLIYDNAMAYKRGRLSFPMQYIPLGLLYWVAEIGIKPVFLMIDLALKLCSNKESLATNSVLGSDLIKKLLPNILKISAKETMRRTVSNTLAVSPAAVIGFLVVLLGVINPSYPKTALILPILSVIRDYVLMIALWPARQAVHTLPCIEKIFLKKSLKERSRIPPNTYLGILQEYEIDNPDHLLNILSTLPLNPETHPNPEYFTHQTGLETSDNSEATEEVTLE